MMKFLSLFILLMITNACAQGKKNTALNSQKPTTNALINESSPYLLQHAHNPVNWYPWGEKALQKAKEEDKLMIISVGYSACHWCHVMEHESFEDSTVAAVMNESFVSIKVDREERPDIDQIYMQAAYLTNQRGGWPLNVIALPDGKPVYAGTYFPKDQWIKMLDFFSEMYIEEKDKLIYQGAQYQQGINRLEAPLIDLSDEIVFEKAAYNANVKTVLSNMDATLGGRKGAPKFPMPAVLEAILQYYFYSSDEEAKAILQVSLDQMASGGIYDQIGGGFARYSTDDQWTVPHFEKMLYDNAQLMSIYSKAYQVFKSDVYKSVVYETFVFIERELTDPSGGFYASLDADSEGEEGKYYVWTKAEIEEILGDQNELLLSYFGVTASGNFEGKNILTSRKSPTALAKKHKVTIEKLNAEVKAAKSILLKKRAERIRPGLDDKILTSWNALMIDGLLDAYQAFGEDRFLISAKKAMQLILDKKMSLDGGLFRNYKNGKASISGFHDDYALTIKALIKMYQATFDIYWLTEAQKLKNYVHEHFYSEERGYYFYTSDQDKALITRKMELSDNVIPGANSVMARNLFELGMYFYEPKDILISKKMTKGMEDNLKTSPNFYSNWLYLSGQLSRSFYEVAIVGKKAAELRQEFSMVYLPNHILLGGKKEGELALMQNKLVPGKTKIYVCEEQACKLPVEDVQKALTLMDK